MSRFKVIRESVWQTMDRAKGSFKNLKGVQKNDGKGLEFEVARLLRKEGFTHVEMNNRVKDVHGNWSEIDVIGTQRDFFHRFFSHSRQIPWGAKNIYVECKQYGPELRVSLGDVSKFKEVLQLNSKPLNHGLFVTTSTFVPRATTIGIRTVDGRQLRSWSRRHKDVNPSIQRAKKAITLGFTIACLFLYSQMVFDIREARTKTTDKAINFQNFDEYKAQVKKENGFAGLLLTSGQSPEQRFSTFVSTYDHLSYWAKYGYYSLMKYDTNTIQLPKRETGQTVQSKVQTPGQQHGYDVFVQPKPDSMYMAYELHRPVPTQDGVREQAIDFIEKEGVNWTKTNPIFKHVPKFLLDYYSRYSMQHDYVLFNVNLKQFPAKFIPNPITSQFFQIVETNGQTYFKVPVHHSLSCPGYMSQYLTYLLTKISKLTAADGSNSTVSGLSTDKIVQNDTEFNSGSHLSSIVTGLFGGSSSQTLPKIVPNSTTNPSEIIGNAYSANGSMSGKIFGNGQIEPVLSKKTAEKTFGDSWFDSSPTSSSPSTSTGADSNSSVDKVNKFDDFSASAPSLAAVFGSHHHDEQFDAPGSNPYLTKGYTMVHEEDEDTSHMLAPSGWKSM